MFCDKNYHDSELTEKRSIRLAGIYITPTVDEELNQAIEMEGYRNQQQLIYCLLLKHLEKCSKVLKSTKKYLDKIKEMDMIELTKDLLDCLQQMNEKLKIVKGMMPTSLVYPIELQQRVQGHIQNTKSSLQKLTAMGEEQANYISQATHNMFNPPQENNSGNQLPNNQQQPKQSQQQQPEGQPLGKIG